MKSIHDLFNYEPTNKFENNNNSNSKITHRPEQDIENKSFYKKDSHLYRSNFVR